MSRPSLNFPLNGSSLSSEVIHFASWIAQLFFWTVLKMFLFPSWNVRRLANFDFIREVLVQSVASISVMKSVSAWLIEEKFWRVRDNLRLFLSGINLCCAWILPSCFTLTRDQLLCYAQSVLRSIKLSSFLLKLWVTCSKYLSWIKLTKLELIKETAGGCAIVLF